MEKKLPKVVFKVNKAEYSILDNMGIRPNDRPYSLIPNKFFEDCSIITYPEIKQNMYTINTRGEIFNIITNTQLTCYMKNNGYYAVTLQTYNGAKMFLVHRLVAYQFCNPPLDYFNKIVNHIDNNKWNNCANNLEWITMAANNQHAIEVKTGASTYITNGRPIVKEDFVRFICEQFEKGKSNTEIMRENGMEINNANHTLLRDIRGGYTWSSISRQYNFDVSSKKHAYTKEEKEVIKNHLKSGKTIKEVFAIMNGREYVASTDRRDSLYRTIQTISASIVA